MIGRKTVGPVRISSEIGIASGAVMLLLESRMRLVARVESSCVETGIIPVASGLHSRLNRITSGPDVGTRSVGLILELIISSETGVRLFIVVGCGPTVTRVFVVRLHWFHRLTRNCPTVGRVRLRRFYPLRRVRPPVIVFRSRAGSRSGTRGLGGGCYRFAAGPSEPRRKPSSAALRRTLGR